MERNPYLQAIGAKIQASRKAKKITIRKLGELTKMDYSTLSRIEGGQYASRITTLKAIADVLEMDVKGFYDKQNGGVLTPVPNLI